MCRQVKDQSYQMMRGLFVVLALAAWLLGVAAPAPAETLKCKGAGMQRVQEGVPVGDVEGHYVGSTCVRAWRSAIPGKS